MANFYDDNDDLVGPIHGPDRITNVSFFIERDDHRG